MSELWYLVHAHTGREELAAEHLKRQSFTPFLPSTWRSVRHARKIKNVRTAFFPSYLFVKLDLGRDRWRSIDSTIGVVRLVKSGAAPQAAPKGLIETLQSMLATDGALDLVGEALQPGAAVRIIRGPFADQLATVEQMSGADRVRVLLTIMNRRVPADVTRADLAIA